MSEDLNREELKRLTMSELEALVRLDFESPEDERDIEQILLENGSDVTRSMEKAEVLAQTYKPLNITGKTAHESLRSFCENYPSEDGLQPSVPGKAAHKPWLRRGIAIAAMLALLVGVPLAASAFNWDALWNTVAKWAKETFSFVSDPDTELTEPDKQDQLQYSSLQDVLPSETGVNKLIPTWIPEGYILEDITIDETPTQKVYLAIYKKGEQTLRICVQSYLTDDLELVETNDDYLKEIDVNGTTYYFFRNETQLRAAWTKESYECYISGELTIEEIEMMIDSIEEG